MQGWSIKIDDPTLPCNTIRAWCIGLTLTTVGAGINCLFSLRSPSIAITTVVSFSSVATFLLQWAPVAGRDELGIGIWDSHESISSNQNYTPVRPTNRMAPRQSMGSRNPRLELRLSSPIPRGPKSQYKIEGGEVEHEGTCNCSCDGQRGLCWCEYICNRYTHLAGSILWAEIRVCVQQFEGFSSGARRDEESGLMLARMLADDWGY